MLLLKKDLIKEELLCKTAEPGTLIALQHAMVASYDKGEAIKLYARKIMEENNHVPSLRI